jgi:heme-degrading monooxygenase HmoA
MTRIHFDEARFDDLMNWAESARPQIEAIDGFEFADLVRTGEGEGMVVAAYDNESSYQEAAETVAAVLGEMAAYLTNVPHTHEGTVVLSYGR